MSRVGGSYGAVAKFLHWMIALWIFTACMVIIWLTWDHTEGLIPGLNYHKAIGFAILLPLLFRVIWRFLNPPPALPASMPRWQKRLSGVSHFLLYFLLFAMPISGYLGNYGGVDYGVFKVPPFWQTTMASWLFDVLNITAEQWDRSFDTFHYRVVGPFVFPAVILIHIAAAIYHHVVLKDDVLRNMLAGR